MSKKQKRLYKGFIKSQTLDDLVKIISYDEKAKPLYSNHQYDELKEYLIKFNNEVQKSKRRRVGVVFCAGMGLTGVTILALLGTLLKTMHGCMSNNRKENKFFKNLKLIPSETYYHAVEDSWYVKGAEVKPKEEVRLSISEEDIGALDGLILSECPKLSGFKLRLDYEGKLKRRVKKEVKRELKGFRKSYKRFNYFEGEDLNVKLTYNINQWTVLE